jgi:hypothetical protein
MTAYRFNDRTYEVWQQQPSLRDAQVSGHGGGQTSTNRTRNYLGDGEDATG